MHYIHFISFKVEKPRQILPFSLIYLQFNDCLMSNSHFLLNFLLNLRQTIRRGLKLTPWKLFVICPIICQENCFIFDQFTPRKLFSSCLKSTNEKNLEQHKQLFLVCKGWKKHTIFRKKQYELKTT